MRSRTPLTILLAACALAMIPSAGALTVTAPLIDQTISADPPTPLPELDVQLPVGGTSVEVSTAPPTQASPPATPAPAAATPSPLQAAAPVATGIGIAALIAAATWLAAHALGAGLFSRIQGPKVLEHDTRARIVQEVDASPGITLVDLRTRLGIAWGTTWHHVRRLEKNGLLVSIRQGPRRLLYAANSPAAGARATLALLRNPTAQRIAQAIHATPDLAATAICRLLALQPPNVSKHLARFTASGLVEPSPIVERGYVATPRLTSALALAA
ncbi:MAG: winged helix-turn-helix transcriptional regulator [bacterium]